MKLKKQDLIVVLISSVLLVIAVVDAYCAQDSTSTKPYQLFWTEVYPDAAGETQVLGWCLEMKPNGFIWDIIASTEGFGEIDLGYGVVAGNWSFIGLVGTDFTINNIKLDRFIPQAYAIYWCEEKKLRFQSWNLAFLSANKPLIRLKNFFTYKGLGLDVEHNTDNGFDVGPITDIPFMNGHLLPEIRYNTISKDWSFKLTFFLEKF